MLFTFFILLFSFCGTKQQEVEKIIEDGVEVVVNHLAPSKIKGEPSTFSLEEEFKIDTESEDLAGLGIRGIDEMDVDSGGSIYLSTGEQVLNFDNTGGFVQSIGRTGHGPGEYQMATSLRITDSGLLSFFDAENSKFLFFNPDGTLAKEIKKTARMFTFVGTKYLKAARSRKFKNNHLYCVSRKESGFEELIAYKIIWQE